MKTINLLAYGMAGCVLCTAAPVLAAKTTLVAALNGASETTGGDPDGAGSFSVEIDADAGDFCYTLTGTKIAKATMAHVHSGAAGANGPPVVTLEVASDMCAAVDPEKLMAMIAAPADYYVNVHNADFPAGAIRGQLAAK
jgi:hypothetical protein